MPDVQSVTTGCSIRPIGAPCDTSPILWIFAPQFTAGLKEHVSAIEIKRSEMRLTAINVPDSLRRYTVSNLRQIPIRTAYLL